MWCGVHVQLRMLRRQLLLLLLLRPVREGRDCRVQLLLLLLLRGRRRCWMRLLGLLFLRQTSHRQGWKLERLWL